jgi:hypothetical protein
MGQQLEVPGQSGESMQTVGHFSQEQQRMHCRTGWYRHGYPAAEARPVTSLETVDVSHHVTVQASLPVCC